MTNLLTNCRASWSLTRLLVLAPALPMAASTPAVDGAAKGEIAHLLDYLGSSRCEFNRNGEWHPAAEARSHLQRKLAHLLRREPSLSAEQFIASAASKSSVSGEPYQVRCTDAAALPSGSWFNAELQRYRADLSR